jgi:hypothetical protein
VKGRREREREKEREREREGKRERERVEFFFVCKIAAASFRFLLLRFASSLPAFCQ